MEKICTVPDCGLTNRIRRGLCIKHYKRDQRYGSTDVVANTRHKSLEDRYWDSLDSSGGEDACWPWTAGIRLSKTTPYGRIKQDGKVYSAHRIGYALANGIEPTELPSTVPVHHTCGNSICQQPKHLQATTTHENTAEMLERNSYKNRIAYLESLLDENGIAYKK